MAAFMVLQVPFAKPLFYRSRFILGKLRAQERPLKRSSRKDSTVLGASILSKTVSTSPFSSSGADNSRKRKRQARACRSQNFATPGFGPYLLRFTAFFRSMPGV